MALFHIFICYVHDHPPVFVLHVALAGHFVAIWHAARTRVHVPKHTMWCALPFGTCACTRTIWHTCMHMCHLVCLHTHVHVTHAHAHVAFAARACACACAVLVDVPSAQTSHPNMITCHTDACWVTPVPPGLVLTHTVDRARVIIFSRGRTFAA